MQQPRIMVAPNGARKTRDDHPQLPVTVPEIVATAVACHQAGAHAIHAHVRDADGAHTLNAGLYRELLQALADAVPDMAVQITTEAVGRYAPQQQRDLLYELRPASVSIAVREMLRDGESTDVRTLYHWAQAEGVKIQHILYSPDDMLWLDRLIATQTVPPGEHDVLFVLGRYQSQQQASVSELSPFLQARAGSHFLRDCTFMVCAFGQAETDCLIAAAQHGGHCRIGFENNLHHADGSLARDNAERVSHLRHALQNTTSR